MQIGSAPGLDIALTRPTGPGEYCQQDDAVYESEGEVGGERESQSHRTQAAHPDQRQKLNFRLPDVTPRGNRNGAHQKGQRQAVAASSNQIIENERIVQQADQQRPSKNDALNER